nr:MAG TPA: hypothetical protein [Caudoviricetes sp.]
MNDLFIIIHRYLQSNKVNNIITYIFISYS